jgi:sulfur relay (sulfurtransferase) DsrC/TusE family protein
MIQLRQTETNHTGAHALGISFFDAFGLTAYEVAAVPPKPLDPEPTQALMPPLGADEFADVIPLFPDLAALQVIELVRKFFPSLNAIQAFQMIRKLFPGLHAAQIIETVQKSFPSLNATKILEIIRRLFQSFSATQALEMIRKLFQKLNMVQIIESIGKLFPGQFRQFPPSVKKRGQFDVLDGMIAHLTRECGGNVHDHHIFDVMSRSFEKEIGRVNPRSGAWNRVELIEDFQGELLIPGLSTRLCPSLSETTSHSSFT